MRPTHESVSGLRRRLCSGLALRDVVEDDDAALHALVGDERRGGVGDVQIAAVPADEDVVDAPGGAVALRVQDRPLRGRGAVGRL